MKSATIMSLEEVLLATQGDVPPRRDPDGYFVSIFGEPSESGAWCFRFEGHHISLHFTIVDGKLSGSPTFFGSNPAKVPEGRRKGLRVLGHEEDLGREVMHSLTPEQQKTAIVMAEPPNEILTENTRQAALAGQPSGIQLSAFNGAQGDKLQSVLQVYCDNMAPEIAAFRREQIRKVGNDLWFAWAGGIQPGDLHYYRIQSPEFLIEFDDTQNHGNHIHSVWRDLKGDFGRDLLADHYRTGHH
jgi:hypothetical protein